MLIVFDFTYSLHHDDIVAGDVYPVTIPNRFSNVYKSFHNTINDKIIVESLLYMFVGLDKTYSIENLFPVVDNQDLGFYNSLRIPSALWIIDDDALMDSTVVNAPTVDDFIIMSLIKRYMGRFMPIMVNAITLNSDWTSRDEHVSIPELYFINYHYNFFHCDLRRL